MISSARHRVNSVAQRQHESRHDSTYAKMEALGLHNPWVWTTLNRYENIKEKWKTTMHKQRNRLTRKPAAPRTWGIKAYMQSDALCYCPHKFSQRKNIKYYNDHKGLNTFSPKDGGKLSLASGINLCIIGTTAFQEPSTNNKVIRQCRAVTSCRSPWKLLCHGRRT